MDLYGVTPPEFVAARKALAAELPEVKALKKPSWPLWAVNQLARRHATAVEALLEAGAALAATHQAILSGKADAEGLREASRGLRDALARAERLAEEALKDVGAAGGAGVLRRLRATLHAAAIAPGATRAALAQGVLDDELTLPDVLSAEPGTLPEGRPVRARRRGAKAEGEGARVAKDEARREAAEARRRAAEAVRREKARAQAKAKATRLDERAAALEEEAAALRAEARKLRADAARA